MSRMMTMIAINKDTESHTACGHRIPHRKWKEIKLQPGTAGPGNRLGCCLVSFHFLWAILCPQAVLISSGVFIFLFQNFDSKFMNFFAADFRKDFCDVFLFALNRAPDSSGRACPRTAPPTGPCRPWPAGRTQGSRL